MSEKRPRSSNFSEDEKIIALGIIKKYKNILESKETGGNSWQEKEKCWDKIQKEFSSQSSNSYRTTYVLKRFYANTKRETRKKAANLKHVFRQTGGGPAPPVKINDPIFDLTLELINQKSVFGLENQFDSDMVQECNSDMGQNIEFVYESDVEIDHEAMQERQVLEVNPESEDVTLATFSKPSTSKEMKTDDATISKPSTCKEMKTVGGTKQKHTPKSYITKRTISKSENVALQYEEVAALRKEVLNVQLKILNAQRDEQEAQVLHNKKIRISDIEEADLRKRSLMLDIKLKEAQLRALN